MDDNKGNSMTDCYSYQLITTQYRWITCLLVTTVLAAWGNFIFPMTSNVLNSALRCTQRPKRKQNRLPLDPASISDRQDT